MSTVLNNVGLAARNDSLQHETQLPIPTSADYACRGVFEEFMNTATRRMDEQQAEIQQLQSQRNEHEEEIRNLRTELGNVVEENYDLKRQLTELRGRAISHLARLEELDDISGRYTDLLEEHRGMRETINNLTRQNTTLRRDLQNAGVRETNWWKVIALALIGGIALSAIAPGIGMYFACTTGAVVTGAVLSGVGVAGGTLRYFCN